MLHLLKNYAFSADSPFCSKCSWKTCRKTYALHHIASNVFENDHPLLLMQTFTVKGEQESPHPTTKGLLGVIKCQPLLDSVMKNTGWQRDGGANSDLR